MSSSWPSAPSEVSDCSPDVLCIQLAHTLADRLPHPAPSCPGGCLLQVCSRLPSSRCLVCKLVDHAPPVIEPNCSVVVTKYVVDRIYSGFDKDFGNCPCCQSWRPFSRLTFCVPVLQLPHHQPNIPAQHQPLVQALRHQLPHPQAGGTREVAFNGLLANLKCRQFCSNMNAGVYPKLFISCT